MAIIREILQVEDRFSQSMTRFNSLGAQMLRVAGAIGGAVTIRGFVALSDSIAQTEARLNSIKGEFAEVADLQNEIFQAAQRSRGNYLDMAANVASIKAQTGEVFKSTAEAVRFTELLNKQFAISGTSAAGIASTMYNLTQALATGVLRGNDLQMVLSNSPAIVQRIAKYLDVDIGKIREMAQQGQITAEIVKNAIMRYGGEIDAEFEKMPLTFGQAMQKLKNEGIRAIQPLAKVFTDVVGSQDFENVLGGLAASIQIFANVAQRAFTLVGNAIGFVREHIDFFLPIVAGLVAAFLYYNVVLGIVTAAQAAFNAVVAANPIMLIVMAVAALIAIIVAAVIALHNFAATGHTVFGDIAGVAFGAFSVIKNALAIVANAFISAAEFIANAWFQGVFNIQTAIYNFVIAAANAFNSVIDAADGAATAIANAFISGANLAIGGINKLIDALNAIPGVDIGKVSTLGSVSSVISARIDTSGLKAPTAPKKVSLSRFETTNMGDAWSQGFNKGAALGDNAQNKLTDALNGLKQGVGDLTSEFSGADLGGYAAAGLGGGKGGGGGKANVGTVDKVKDVSLSDEDMKIYRDLAERRYMANVELQSLAPNISVSIPESAAANLTSQDVADKLKVMLIDMAASHTAVAHAH